MLKLYKNFLNKVYIENENGRLMETELVSPEMDTKAATLNLNKHAACIEYEGHVYNTGLESKQVLDFFGLI